MSGPGGTAETPLSLEEATNYARSGRDWDRIYQYICKHPADFFTILPGRRWSIAHQAVYHGDVNLFKRLLALFSVQQIDIRSKAGDDKTLLAIAKDRQAKNQEMFTYIEHLFDQDELIEAAKARQWPKVLSLLEKNRYLINEKPPYSPCFLLHHVVTSGNEQILKQLLEHTHLVTEVRNVDNETPLQLATRLNRSAMCSLLRRDTHPPPVPAPALSLPVKTSAPTYSPPRTTYSQPPIPQKIQHVDTHKTIVMSPVEYDEQMIEELTCVLSGQLFVDPVIASDGITYERSFIVDWINKYHSSPTTAALMNGTLKENVEMKRRADRFRTSSSHKKN